MDRSSVYVVKKGKIQYYYHSRFLCARIRVLSGVGVENCIQHITKKMKRRLGKENE